MREEDQTPKYNTAQMLVKCLEKEGVEYIFGIPGEENLEIMEALSHSNIRFITTRHEQGALLWPCIWTLNPQSRCLHVNVGAWSY